MRQGTPEGAGGPDESSSAKRQKLSDETALVEDDSDSLVVHGNQPVQMSVYRDPETGMEMVIVVAALIGGVTDANFSVVGDGPGTRTVRIDYLWPAMSFDIEGIFAQEINDESLPVCHPKIEALKKDLEKCRSCIDQIPKGSIELTLPIPVQTIVNSVKITGKKTKDGTRFLIAELMGYQNAYMVKEKDKVVVFKDI